MNPNDPNIRWIEEPKLGLAGRMYLPMLLQGLGVTSKHLVGPKVTVSYPDEQPTIGNPLIYRGVHRLNRDEQGRVKCVACFLCATACQAHCIDIVAA
jgi:NADH-quinone oxidoreductase subunit I